MLLMVKVTANSRHPKIVGLVGNVLHIKVSAPPIDGRANAEVCDAVAKLLGLSVNQIEIKAGHSAKLKTLSILGVDESKVFAILKQHLDTRSPEHLNI
ncbi:MAG: DUF167 domain-containing protein [Patescibacteria group bacterium]